MAVEHIDEKEWVICPYCHKQQFPVEKDTKIERFPWKCKKCKQIFEVNTKARA